MYSRTNEFHLVNIFTLFQALSVYTDYIYYQKWTSSVLNLLVYNVVGGGESHLYGTEGPLYYLRNGFNNFNFCFVLALMFLGILPITRKKYTPDLLVIVSPMYIWLAFMSLQPHKEERLENTKLAILWYIKFHFEALSLGSTDRGTSILLNTTQTR